MLLKNKKESLYLYFSCYSIVSDDCDFVYFILRGRADCSVDRKTDNDFGNRNIIE